MAIGLAGWLLTISSVVLFFFVFLSFVCGGRYRSIKSPLMGSGGRSFLLAEKRRKNGVKFEGTQSHAGTEKRRNDIQNNKAISFLFLESFPSKFTRELVSHFYMFFFLGRWDLIVPAFGS
jgi:hypothetical protein